nr:alpha/beta hydrolase [uncultured Rhodoferax sp.]
MLVLMIVQRPFAVCRALLLVLYIFAALPTMGQEQPAQAQSDFGPVAQASALRTDLDRIGGYGLEFWIRRAERPRATVIFENGLMLSLETWQKVAEQLSGEVNILLYNRPGVGRSELPRQPQDAAYATRQLEELARRQGLRPPYIVVGHSMGGQYAQLFAMLYPEQVSGMVLVDALPLGALKSSSDFPWYTRLGLWVFAPDYARREIHNAYAMGQSLLSRPGNFRKPLIRLVADTDPAATKPEGIIKGLLKGVVYAEDFGVWAMNPDDAERHLDHLYPDSVVHRLKANHRLPELVPEVVVEAIIDAIRQADVVKQCSAVQPGYGNSVSGLATCRLPTTEALVPAL